MSCPHSFSICLVAITFLSLCGCDGNSLVPGQGTAGAEPFGPPDRPVMLAPFEGDWTFNLEKTLEAREASGASPKEIEQARKMHSLMSAYGGLHGNLAITGTVLTSAGQIPSEYLLFSMHKHGDTVCGKAWHHEDRHDPGDMSKCRVQMKLQKDRLLLKIRWQASSVNLNDPDLTNPEIINPAAASTCDSDTLPDGPDADWSPWNVFIFDNGTT